MQRRDPIRTHTVPRMSVLRCECRDCLLAFRMNYGALTGVYPSGPEAALDDIKRKLRRPDASSDIPGDPP
jgi:hypothetical protein